MQNRRRKGILRRLIRTATHIVSEGYEREDEVEVLLNEAEKKILEVSHRKNAKDSKTLKMYL